MKLNYTVRKDNKYNSVDDVISKEFNISNRLRTKLINNKKIYLNNLICDTRSKLSLNDTITIDFNYEEDNSNIQPTKMNLKILYEDEWFLAVDKPNNIPSHPSRSHYSDSLSNGIRYYFDSINLKKIIRPINRLDLNTSGVMLFAKCEYIQECFIEQMKQNIFQKEYLCIVDGNLPKKSGTIDLPISRKSGSIIEREINKNGKPSITYYEVIKDFPNYSLLKCKLETGRTHQIRVHMSAISHPILGDTLYGNPSNLISRQALHSYKIKFIHPISKESISIISSIPSDMYKLLNQK